ncbi:MAG: DUF1549 and DUF1553 domain-containing protein, partial [Gemmataceae bacterium]
LKEKGKGQNEIDAFIRAKLVTEKLQPAAPADPTTLVRRLYLDLLGLPPTPEQVDAFVKDPSPAAVQKLVKELLASPHYGERWGRLWLDAARYADSDGFEKDKPRFVAFYRDWVVGAMNRDLPYNQFLREQIAGDLFPNATQDQRVATGFLRNSMINEEGGVDPEQFRMEAMFDRMDAIGKAMLGLTIQCAQCHTHKYDPISHTDYYRLFAYLNNSHEANIAVYTPAEQTRRAELYRQIQMLETELKTHEPKWREQMTAWANTQRGTMAKWIVPTPTIPDETTGGGKYLRQPDGSYLQQSYAPTKHSVRFEYNLKEANLRSVLLELLTDANLPRGGPGRSIQGTAALTEFEVWTGDPAKNGQGMTKIKFTAATADHSPAEAPIQSFYDDKSNRMRIIGPASFAIDGKDETAWATDADPARRNQSRKIVFTAEKPFPSFPGGTLVHVYIKQNHGGWNSDDNQNYNLGRMRVSFSSGSENIFDPLPAELRQTIEANKPLPETAFGYWRTTVPAWKEVNAKIDALFAQFPEGTTQLSLAEREELRPTHLLKRGDFLKPADRMTPGTPQFISIKASSTPNRLGLADWIADPQNPTPARAIVNRVWQSYFGTGIVSSPEDLGTQAEDPSHPELLDWLATQFQEDGWSLKKLHERIVTSATYQQESRLTPELAARDPMNRLLARGPRYRADAEVVRDIVLAASGLLNPQVGGGHSFPPVPGFLMLPPASYGPKVWIEDTGTNRYHRSLYVFRFRSVPYPPLLAFDAPTGDFACVKRSRSNTPLQALTTLNEPIFVEAARALGLLVLKQGGTDTEKLTFAFRRCVSRKPSEAELKTLLEMFARQKAKYADPGADAWTTAFGSGDVRKLPPTATAAEAAAWTAIARVLLNLDETITKE